MESVSVPLVVARYEIHDEEVIGGGIQSEESTLRALNIYITHKSNFYTALRETPLTYYGRPKSLYMICYTDITNNRLYTLCITYRVLYILYDERLVLLYFIECLSLET